MKNERTIIRALHSICYFLKGTADGDCKEDALDCSMQELGYVEGSFSEPKKPEIQKTPAQLIVLALCDKSLTKDDIYEIIELVMAHEVEDDSL